MRQSGPRNGSLIANPKVTFLIIPDLQYIQTCQTLTLTLSLSSPKY